MHMPTRAALSLLRGHVAHAGLEMPTGVTAAEKAAQAIEERINSIGAQPHELHAAVADALAAGRDAASDPEVQRLVTARSIANDGVRESVVADATDRLRAAYTVHADEIVETLRPAFNAAAAVLEEAAQVLDIPDIREAPDARGLSPEAAGLWARARQAADTVARTGKAWRALMSLAASEQVNGTHKALQYAEVDWRTWQDLDLDSPTNAQPWSLVKADLPLSLPTLEEYRRRVAALSAGAQRERDEAERRTRDAMVGKWNG